MRRALKIFSLTVVVFVVYLIIPNRKIEPEARILTEPKQAQLIKRIILVYNAKSDNLSVVQDFFHKLLSPKTYPCHLCYLTFGVFSMKSEWKDFLDSIPVDKQYLHKDEFEKKYNIHQKTYPAIYASDDKDLWELLSKQEINNCKSLYELENRMREKLKQ